MKVTIWRAIGAVRGDIGKLYSARKQRPIMIGYGVGMRNLFILLLPILTSACSGAASKPPTPPAHSELIAHESELLRLTLTPQAAGRLGIVTIHVGEGTVTAVRQAAGEIMAPPTAAGGIPIGSVADLQQIGSQQAVADGEIARQVAQARLARIALTRAEGLVREEAGSVRARDEAAASLVSAEAALAAARQQRRLLGPAVASLNAQSMVWVRVSVFGSDLGGVERDAIATVRPLGAGGPARSGRPVQGIPSANSAAGTVDLYYALPNHDGFFRVGQRVAVELAHGGSVDGLSVPSSAIVRDIYGGEWVYQKTAPNTFVRQRVAVTSERDGKALLARGLSRGAEVVTTGAAELFGTEFGAAH